MCSLKSLARVHTIVNIVLKRLTAVCLEIPKTKRNRKFLRPFNFFHFWVFVNIQPFQNYTYPGCTRPQLSSGHIVAFIQLAP